MLAPLGRILILASLFAAAAGALIGFYAGRTRSAEGLRWARRFAYAYAATIIAATLVMVYALLVHDFSVSYVAHVGSTQVPTWVTVVSLWSSLEGSILFWGLVLGAYIAIAT
ncbi:MAG: heme lyase CcmF/NrfE family subunit, partial [Thermoanaerobaculia bacterium]